MLSAYDPRDLFSREPARVGKALHALLEAPNVRVGALSWLAWELHVACASLACKLCDWRQQ